MGTLTTNPSIMKLVKILSVSLLGYTSAQLTTCIDPDYEFIPATFPAHKPIDFQAIQDKIDVINAGIEAGNPKLEEGDILDFDFLKTKFGDRLVENLAEIQAQKEIKIIKKDINNELSTLLEQIKESGKLPNPVDLMNMMKEKGLKVKDFMKEMGVKGPLVDPIDLSIKNGKGPLKGQGLKKLAKKLNLKGNKGGNKGKGGKGK